MMQPIAPPPHSQIETVVDVFHGVSVADPYRWLEDQNAQRTRAWIADQTSYARRYLDGISCRERLRSRVRALLSVQTYDSVQKARDRFIFRKRLPDQEQPCIYMREGPNGADQMLIDPAERGTGSYTAVKPIRVSPDGRLLLYEVKQGGERTATIELLDIETRERLPDVLNRGYLRGIAFAPDSRSFYYVHETHRVNQRDCRTAYHHLLGEDCTQDSPIFQADSSSMARLYLVSDSNRLGFIVREFAEGRHGDFYVVDMAKGARPRTVIKNAPFSFGPLLVSGRILVMTNRNAPNLRIVELTLHDDADIEWTEIIPEDRFRINQWIVAANHIFVSYFKESAFHVYIFDMFGRKVGEVPISSDETVQLTVCSPLADEMLFETESFTKPLSTFRFSINSESPQPFSSQTLALDRTHYRHEHTSYAAKDGTRIPLFLLGSPDVLASGTHPTILTSYGGFGACMSPRFSTFVSFLIELGCLFALPGIRGGSEFGTAWHDAGRRQNRQTAYDDFLSAAEWLVQSGRSEPQRLAIFGGSNSGLLVGAALTQRPDLFRAVLCMVPMLDMLRYHLFDNAHVWKEEFGSVQDPDDFAVLARYSPYQNVRPGTAYPATMIVSGDADQNCNPLHARKMTARLQAANVSGLPIFLDYSEFRGHSPVLPLSVRIEALTDRLAFLCDQLQLSI